MTIIHPDSVPLRVDETGTIRVANTRITLDVFLGFFKAGASPEQLISADYYPALSLADVYGVLAYYHRHTSEIEEYLQRRSVAADKLQAEIEATQPSYEEVKARLIAKRNAAHAPPAG